jgi:glycosyltransferase involved in cell wall biosynthesis
MRIVHVITKGDVGGAQTHVVDLALTQVEMGDECVVIAGTDGAAMQRLREHGVSVRILPAIGRSRSKSRANVGTLKELRAALAEIEPDVVHGHSSHAGLLARAAARRDGYPSVYTAHGWPFQRGAAFGQRTMSLIGESVGSRLGDGVICLTDAEADLARRWRVASPPKVWVIPNGLRDIAAQDRRPPGRVGPVRLTMVARFAPPKQQRELIEVLATLTHDSWNITFVGDGPDLAECSRLANQLIGPRCAFLGASDQVSQVLAASDVLVLWSKYEGLPISLLEGMRAGLCCVASDLPGVRRLFGDPPVGIVAGDAAALATTLDQLVIDRQRCDRLGALARAEFERRYSADAMALRVREVYEAVLERRTRSSAG